MKSGARLEKMLLKKKKKFYYDPMNTAQLGKMAIGAGGKSKYRSEDTIRLRTYNKILHESISDILSGNSISEEIEQLQVTVLGVRVTGDMSACRVYWMSTGAVEDDDKIENVLNKHKGPLRHALISHRVLGRIPPIVFLKDKASASIAEIDRLLAKADFGPEEEEELEEVMLSMDDQEVDSTEAEGRMEFMGKAGNTGSPRADLSESPPPLPQPSMFGIDHAAVNQMIQAGRTSLEPPLATDSQQSDRAADRQFQEFRAFLKRKKKLGKAERKQSAYYKGELEAGKSTGSEAILNDEHTDEDFENFDSRYDNEGEFEENAEDVELRNDNLPPSEQQSKEK